MNAGSACILLFLLILLEAIETPSSARPLLLLFLMILLKAIEIPSSALSFYCFFGI